MEVQRPAAPGAGSGQGRMRAGGAHHGQRGAVHVALPRVHDAPGEQECVRVDVTDERRAQ